MATANGTFNKDDFYDDSNEDDDGDEKNRAAKREKQVHVTEMIVQRSCFEKDFGKEMLLHTYY